MKVCVLDTNSARGTYIKPRIKFNKKKMLLFLSINLKRAIHLNAITYTTTNRAVVFNMQYRKKPDKYFLITYV